MSKDTAKNFPTASDANETSSLALINQSIQDNPSKMLSAMMDQLKQDIASREARYERKAI